MSEYRDHIKVVVISPTFSKTKILQDETYKYFPQTKLNLEGRKFNKNELIEFIKEADAIVLGVDQIDEEVLLACKNLKIISKYGVGIDNIDLEACKKRNIKIGWTGGVNKRSTSEMTLGYMLMLSRNIYLTSNQLKEGIWNRSAGFQLSGKTIGIIGIGEIGKDLIQLLKPFNCKILVNNNGDQDEYISRHNLTKASKEEIYKESDFISIHTPLNEATKNMINIETFRMMKKSSFIMNSARGEIINKDDLKYALKNALIAGAAIDVYVSEPPTDRELIALPNLICTPHIGGTAKEAAEALGMSCIKHLREYFEA